MVGTSPPRLVRVVNIGLDRIGGAEGVLGGSMSSGSTTGSRSRRRARGSSSKAFRCTPTVYLLHISLTVKQQ